MKKDEIIELAAIALGEYEIKNGGRAWHKKSDKSRERYRRRAECVYWVIEPEIMEMTKRNHDLEELLRTAISHLNNAGLLQTDLKR